LIKPEERLAQRLLARHNITKLPFDLEALVKHYAILEYIEFPTDADGLVIGIGFKKKPEILINSKLNEKRKKFTLAHELGHIIIPWHTGTIISHTNAEFNANLESDYRTMEAEANRFAAELLMPSKFLDAYYSDKKDIDYFIKTVMNMCGTSLDSILIKTFQSITNPIICFELNFFNKKIQKIFSTKSAPQHRYSNSDILDSHPFAIPAKISSFSINGRFFKAWEFQFDMIASIEENDSREWREILNQILQETQLEREKLSINSILASAFQRNKNLEKEIIYKEILKSFGARNNIISVVRHPLFKEFIIQ
jgi:Zn-dependent peptidase ImmA (M78 family)